jgi:serine/threonine-protein kinase
VYARGGDIMAVGFDADRLTISGQPVAIEHGGMFDQASGSAHFALARNGTFVFAPGGPVLHERKLAWVDRRGTVTPLPMPARFYSDPAIAPDGRAIAFDIRAANDDIWTYAIARGRFARLTFTHGNHQAPAWSPDGSRIIYGLDRLGVRRLAWRAADGSDAEELLTPPEFYQTPGSISADGKILAYTEDRPQTSSDLYVMPLQGTRTAIPFLATPRREYDPRFSPDGRWIAYVSDESGRPEIFVTGYPGHDRKWQVSTTGGTHPVWLRGGKELVYVAADPYRVMIAPVSASGASFEAGDPRELMALPPSTVGFDVAPDGDRVLALMASGDQDSVREIEVALNWFSVLRSRVPR